MQCKEGYVRTGTKCEKRTLKPTTWFSGSENNPFKMWGSWIGAVVFTILTFNPIVGGYIIGKTLINIGIPENFVESIFNFTITKSGFLYLFFYLFITLSLGFLLGWGIHYLIRRFRK